MMAQCDGEGIGGIKTRVQIGIGYLQRALEHGGHLLFGGGSIAGDGYLDLHRRIFEDRNVALCAGCHGHSLCSTELDHGLGVDAYEGRLDGQFVGMILVDETQDTFVNALETEVVALKFGELQDTHDDETRFAADDLKDSIAHDVGAGVDAEDDFVDVWMCGCGHCLWCGELLQVHRFFL